MYFDKTIELILQTEQSSHEYLCEGFSGIPVNRPCHIILVTDGTSESHQNAQKLRKLIHQEIHYLAPSCSLSQSHHCCCYPRCYCYHHYLKNCLHYRKLLVLIGDGNTKFPKNLDFECLMHKSENFLALPVVPKANEEKLSSIMEKSVFSTQNAFCYNQDIAETIPAIFSAVGLTTEENRIFISYRREETQKLANQLFDFLSREGFDVFLDRFSVPPAINFQERLTQELANKSMVLLLESPTFDKSEWTRYEIAFAVKHRLGLLAIQTRGGKSIKGILNSSRVLLEAKDYDTNNKEILNPNSLMQVISRIKLEHGRKLVWKRNFLRICMKSALKKAGLRKLNFDPTGVINVETSNSKSATGTQNYAIRLTSRPPELRDFRDTHLQVATQGSLRGLVIGPISAQELTRKDELSWLENVSGIHCFDEGKMLSVAKTIKADKL